VAIQKSAKGGFGAGVRDGHSPELIAKISLFLNRELPQPSYSKSDDGPSLMEGALSQVVSNIYERNAKARKLCIDHFGSACQVCLFTFFERYGDVGDGFIHVHHIKPVSTRSGKYQIDPVRDLRPVCPNCHAMIHKQDPPLSIDELRNLLR
jgi:5-methylcytosine-specific restriction protein A